MDNLRTTGKTLGLTVTVFAIIGIGIGLTGFFPMEYVVNQFSATGGGQIAQAIGQLLVGVVFLQSFLMAMFLGPTVAGVTGLVSALSLDDRGSAAIAGGVGGVVGFYLMVIIAIVIMSAAMPAGDGGGTGGQQATDLSQLLGPLLKSGFPSGLVGAATGVLGQSYLNQSSQEAVQAQGL